MEKFEFEALIKSVPRKIREEAELLLEDNMINLSFKQVHELNDTVKMFFPKIKKQ